MNMFGHHDVLAAINGKLPLPEKVEYVHGLLKARFDFIDRVAVAVYDQPTDLLKTFVHSSGGESPLALYDAKLSDSESLQEILRVGRPRLVNDLEIFRMTPTEHAKRLAAKHYQSSYTMPMFLGGQFFGFLFFNSYQKNVFEEGVLYHLDIIGHLLSLLVMHEMSTVRTLVAMVKTVTDMTERRDRETGAHLQRMSNYSRLIAKGVADKYRFSDEMVEHVFRFSVLHDIGKIGIPDSILHKPSKLNEEEFNLMKTHTRKGKEIVDKMLENLSLLDFPHAETLRNITLYHHEAIDGSGYHGLTDGGIPGEAKIVAVADVFDALTSTRPYKEAWTNDQAFEYLQTLAGIKFDRDCVNALVDSRIQVEDIQKKFREDELG
jgi:HD-GYP domain-containing protein (c-di-GMP phosphodiesterase class II)